MLSVFSAAVCLLEHTQKTSPAKLQALLYYCQAWSLVYNNEPMFPDIIKAKESGPIIPAVLYETKGHSTIDAHDLYKKGIGKPDYDDLKIIHFVINNYNHMDSIYLIDQIKKEEPYQSARLISNDSEISKNMMLSFYSQHLIKKGI